MWIVLAGGVEGREEQQGGGGGLLEALLLGIAVLMLGVEAPQQGVKVPVDLKLLVSTGCGPTAGCGTHLTPELLVAHPQQGVQVLLQGVVLTWHQNCW